MRKLVLGLLLLAPVFCVAHTLKVGIYGQSSPLVQVNEQSGAISGFIPELMDALLAREGMVPDYVVFTSEAQATQALTDGTVMLLVAPGQAVPEGTLRSSPLISIALSMMTIGPQTGALRRVIVFQGMNREQQKALTQQGYQIMGEPQRTLDALRQLVRGEAQGYVAPMTQLDHFLRENPFSSPQLEPLTTVPSTQYVINALPGARALMTTLDQDIQTYPRGDYAALAEKWKLPPPDNGEGILSHPGRQRTPIRAVIYRQPEPYVATDPQGSVGGVFSDILRKMFPPEEYDLDLRLEENLNLIRSGLIDGRVDVVVGIPEPQQGMLTAAFTHQPWALGTRDSTTLTGSVGALEHRRLAIVQSGHLRQLLNSSIPSASVIETHTLGEAVNLVNAGAADGVIDSAMALSTLTKGAHVGLTIMPVDLPPESIYFEVSPHKAFLQQYISEQVNALTESYISLLEHHWQLLLEKQSTNLLNNYHHWIIIAGVAFILVILFSLFSVFYFWDQNALRIRTERRLKDAIFFWEGLLNSVPTPIFVSDPSGHLTHYNHSFARVLKLREEDAPEAQLISDLLTGELTQWLGMKQRIALLENDAPLLVQTHLDLAGETLTIYFWLSRYCDSHQVPQGFIGGWLDISENARLETALEKALEKSRRASQEKSNFLAHMSHEIRTPLNAIIGILEIESARQISTGAPLQTAYRASVSLLGIIGDILDLSKIEAGELQLTLTAGNLSQDMDLLVETYQQQARNKQLTLTLNNQLPQDSWYQFDRIRLKQVVANLISNAIKYTESGSVNVDICIRSSSNLSDDIVITVMDTGIGMSPTSLGRVMDPYVQIDDMTPNSTGLGLAICRQLVQMMQGKITLNSIEGKGTVVGVALQLARCPAEHLPAAPSVENMPELPSLFILVVDDFEGNCTVMRMQLEKHGHRVTTVQSAEQALTAMRLADFDVLLTDCQMPGMDGYSLVTNLLFTAVMGDIHCPAVILGCTANALAREETRALHAGMDGLLVKPLSEQRLNDAVAEHYLLAKNEHQFEHSELSNLAAGNPAALRTMLQQILDTTVSELGKIKIITRPEDVLPLAHKLKGCFALTDYRSGLRLCSVYENLDRVSRDYAWPNDAMPRLQQKLILTTEHYMTIIEAQLTAEISGDSAE
jgi:two-component system sensor histidine kinase EvgS